MRRPKAKVNVQMDREVIGTVKWSFALFVTLKAQTGFNKFSQDKLGVA